MIDSIARANSWLNALVWGPPMLILLMGTGVLLLFVTGGVQFRHLGTALGEVLGKLRNRTAGKGNVTPFQAVATALASTVGVGNIAGVATAIGNLLAPLSSNPLGLIVISAVVPEPSSSAPLLMMSPGRGVGRYRNDAMR